MKSTKNHSFSSILNLGNFLVATSVTFLLSLLLNISHSSSKITVNINYKDFSLFLFIFIIIAELVTWIIYNAKYKKLDIDGEIENLEIFSLLIFFSSIILFTIGVVFIIEPIELKNIDLGIGLIGIGFVIQPISDSLTLLNARKAKRDLFENKEGGSFTRLTMRISASLAFLFLGSNYSNIINDPDLILFRTSNQVFIEYFLIILVVIIIVINFVILGNIFTLDGANQKNKKYI